MSLTRAWPGSIALVLVAACTSTELRAAPAQPAPVIATATPTPALAPTVPPTPTVAPTPAPVLHQLTRGGCCTQPFWSPDGSQVWYVDRPSAAAPVGIWGVGLDGGEPQFITDRLGLYSADGSRLAYPERGQTYVERLGGERWAVPSDGNPISFSPDGRLIAWQLSSSTSSFDRRRMEVWIANVDGTEAHAVGEFVGGGFSGWFPDSRRVLVSGRTSPNDDPMLAALDVESGDLTIIVSGARTRGTAISPGGGWVAYQVTFSGDAAQDGLWVARADGTGSHRLDVFGAYRWRAEGRLVIVPLEMGAPSHRLIQFAATSGETQALTDPAFTSFRISGGDWAVSPDGNHVAFVSADDHNIWVIDLPGARMGMRSLRSPP